MARSGRRCVPLLASWKEIGGSRRAAAHAVGREARILGAGAGSGRTRDRSLSHSAGNVRAWSDDVWFLTTIGRGPATGEANYVVGAIGSCVTNAALISTA